MVTYSVSYMSRKWMTYIEYEALVHDSGGSEAWESWQQMTVDGAKRRTRSGLNIHGIDNCIEMWIHINLSPVVVDEATCVSPHSVLEVYKHW